MKSAGFLEDVLSLVACGVAIGLLASMQGALHLPGMGAALLLISIGASAVLVFGAAHSPFSTIRSVLSGHMISAFIGVCCAKWIPWEVVAAGAAVGLSLGAMRALRCIHPPAGSSALLAVVGSEAIRSLGFSYVLNPVLINAAALCAFAAIFRAIRKLFEKAAD
jgi:CBS-domain-containing membrane protein